MPGPIQQSQARPEARAGAAKSLESRGMFGGSGPSVRGTPALITGLTVLAIGAMAAAIPPARLAPKVSGVERGYLVGSASFSDMMAEFLSGQGYTYMAIDFTRVRLGSGEVWRAQFDAVSRIFPVWGFVDVRGRVDQATRVASSLPLAGIYLYGATPDDVAAVRASKPGLRVVPVLRAGQASAAHADAATAFAPARFTDARSAKLPVLLAGTLGPAELDAARANLEGDYLVSSIALAD